MHTYIHVHNMKKKKVKSIMEKFVVFFRGRAAATFFYTAFIRHRFITSTSFIRCREQSNNKKMKFTLKKKKKIDL